MDKDFLGLFLPAGILEYFEISSIAQKQDAYYIGLDERNIIPEEYSAHHLESKGFYEASLVQDFPIRGKACYLKVRRRRWKVEGSGQIVSRNWELVAKGTRMTREFASFLKALHRFQTGKL